MTDRTNLFARTLLAAFLMFTLAACEKSLSGTYTSQGGLIAQTMSFKPGGKVEVSAMGMTQVGDYEVVDKKVKISIAGSTTILTIDDDGCLSAGSMLGKFCKE